METKKILKQILISLFLFTSILEAYSLSDSYKKAVDNILKKRYTYELVPIEFDENGTDEEKYGDDLYDLKLIDKVTKKTITTFKLAFIPKFCEGDADGCYGTGVKLLYLKKLKYPLIIINSKLGVHSGILAIYNPNTNITQRRETTYTGNYGIDYKINSKGVSILYDSDCKNFECPNYLIRFYSPFYDDDRVFLFSKFNKEYFEDSEKVEHFSEFFLEYIYGQVNPYTEEEKKIELNIFLGKNYIDNKSIKDIAYKHLKVVQDKMINNGIPKEYIKISLQEDEEYPDLKNVQKVYYTIW